MFLADRTKWLERQCEDIEKYYGEYKTREVYKICLLYTSDAADE